MADKFTERAQCALNNALRAASELGHTYIGTEHLLLGLARENNCAAAKMLLSRGVSHNSILHVIVEYSGKGIRSSPTPSDMTPRAKHIIESAYASARQTPVGYIGTEHLLYAILEEKDCVATKLLQSLGINISELKNDILAFLGGGKRPENKSKNAQSADAKDTFHYGRNLTELAEAGKLDPIIGREKETSRMIEILARRTKNNPCLLGDPGVGKTAIIEGLAQRLVRGNVPEVLQGKTLLSLDLSAMIAGAKYRGEFEERLKNVTEMLLNNPNIILFIDELHTIVGAGAAEGAVDAANILKPLLARGEIRLIGATTVQEYRRTIEKDAALERRFQPISIEEPSNEEALQILHGLKGKYEAHHKIKISDEAMQAAVDYSARYIPDRHLPDKAIDLLDEAAARLRIHASALSPEIHHLEEEISTLDNTLADAIRDRDFERAAVIRDAYNEKKDLLEKQQNKIADPDIDTPTLTKSHIADVVTSWTGIPLMHLTGEEGQRLASLESELAKHIVGQNDAIHALSDAIRRNRTGVRDPSRPIGSFLFAGPTGVGKTELSKVLSKFLYGRDDALIRFDMSEYKENISIAKLIGSPPGYVGYEEGGRLTEQVRRHPYSVILFDEIEKAHEDIFHLLLQILDEGILTDSHGHSVNFKNTILIMTSNLGAKFLSNKPSIGFSGGDANAEMRKNEIQIIDEIKSFFRPEFINRLDEIIVFRPLDKESLRVITALMTERIKERLLSHGIDMSMDTAALDWLSTRGYDKSFGARPMRRIITKELETPISHLLLHGDLKNGDSLSISVIEDQLEFHAE